MSDFLKYMNIILHQFMFKVTSFFFNIKMIPYVIRHPEYCFLFSKESDKRLNEYIQTCDIRIKKLTAESMIGSISNLLAIAKKYEISKSEMNLIGDLIEPIKKELKIL